MAAIDDAIAAIQAQDPNNPAQAPSAPQEATDPLISQLTSDNPVSATQVTSPGQFDQFMENPAARPGMGVTGVAPGQLAQIGSAGVGSSQSTSHAGIAGGPATVAGLFNDAETRSAADATRLQGQAVRDRAQIEGDAGNEKKASDMIGAATEQYNAEQAHLNDRLADMKKTQAELFKQADLAGQVAGAQTLAVYKQQLAGVAALASSSANPLDHLNASGIAGLGFAAFAQGFLAAGPGGGVKIDVTDQIDKWVDRSMKQRQQQIENARGQAQDTLHLYDIARQTSKDEAEARIRYTGMIVEAAQSTITANADRFHSNIAVANAQLANAQLAIKAHEAERAITDKTELQVANAHKENITEAYNKGQLLQQHDQMMSTERMHYATLAAAKVKATKAPPTVQYLIDPVTKRPLGKVTAIPDTNATERIKAYGAAREGYESETKELKDFVQLRSEAGEQGYLGKKASELSGPQAENFRRMEVMRSDLISRLALARSGKTVNPEEYKRLSDQLMDDSKWQTGDNNGVINDYGKHLRQDLESAAHSNTDQTVNDDGTIGLTKEERNIMAHEETADPDRQSADNAYDHAPAAGTSKADKLSAAGLQTGESSHPEGVAGRINDAMDPGFKTHDPHLTTNMSTPWVNARGGARDDGSDGYLRYKTEEPGWAHALDAAAHGAASGDADMLAHLRGIAEGAGPAKEASQVHVRYARALIKQLDNDPKALVESLATKIEGDGQMDDAQKADEANSKHRYGK